MRARRCPRLPAPALLVPSDRLAAVRAIRALPSGLGSRSAVPATFECRFVCGCARPCPCWLWAVPRVFALQGTQRRSCRQSFEARPIKPDHGRSKWKSAAICSQEAGAQRLKTEELCTNTTSRMSTFRLRGGGSSCALAAQLQCLSDLPPLPSRASPAACAVTS
jgi:hypothetical protein